MMVLQGWRIIPFGLVCHYDHVQPRGLFFYQGQHHVHHGGFRAGLQVAGKARSVALPSQSTEGTVMSIIPGMKPDVDGVENDFRQQSHVQRFEYSAHVLSSKRFSKERHREHTSPLYGSPATTLV